MFPPGTKSCVCIYGLVIVLIFAGTAPAAQKRPATVAELALYKGADRQQILEEGARKEGKLMLYTVGILTQTVRPKVAAFQKKYPYIKVEIWRASTNELFARIFEEYMAGRHVVDVIESAQSGEVIAEERGIIQPFYSPNLAFIEEGTIRNAPGGGAFAAGHYESPYGVGYNTKLIAKAELPKAHKDLLDPKWKGKSKVAISGDTAGANWTGLLLVAYGEEFVKRMAKQDFTIQMVTPASIRDMVINGEYVLSPTIADSHVSESKKKGSPVDWFPLEPAYVNLGQTFLPKYPASPNAALLFTDFTLSKEAGELYLATGYDSPRKDLDSGTARYKKFYGPFSTKQFSQWQGLFNELFLHK